MTERREIGQSFDLVLRQGGEDELLGKAVKALVPDRHAPADHRVGTAGDRLVVILAADRAGAHVGHVRVKRQSRADADGEEHHHGDEQRKRDGKQ